MWHVNVGFGILTNYKFTHFIYPNYVIQLSIHWKAKLHDRRAQQPEIFIRGKDAGLGINNME